MAPAELLVACEKLGIAVPLEITMESIRAVLKVSHVPALN